MHKRVKQFLKVILYNNEIEVKVKVYSLWHLEMSLFTEPYNGVVCNVHAMGDCSFTFLKY